jgi:hypothetical protein
MTAALEYVRCVNTILDTRNSIFRKYEDGENINGRQQAK